ncbi:tetratricopeptide repeat protein [Hydrogenophaga sp. BPS33]|uniref:tetratricopeptide repeat protein n=1 Tax=Hydrogenophaga sp. BPS33 TaxID=2651974 RepID=UPI00131FBB02|nr:tetratricopeptide repeat protein [Hydrogenophaga sp. BPS33]QHE87599.1 tetratricopeptide repeat protein [Hydrogenophaga sp. BPS33]
MPTHRSPPDEAQLMAVRDAVRAELQDLSAFLERSTLLTLPKASLGKLRGLDAATYFPVHEAAEALCDQARFEEALPLALYLMVHEPGHQPFNFLAASCLHRLGHLHEAAELYASAVNGGPDDAIALFRLGECLETSQRRKQAREAYEAALDVSRDNADLWQLQDWAMARSHALNHTQESQHER